MRTLVAALALSLLACGPSSPPPKVSGQQQALEPQPATDWSKVPAAERAYLKQLDRLVQPRWRSQLQAASLLPDDHPVNRRGLAVTVELVLDGSGRLKRYRVLRSSGVVQLDNSALLVASWLRGKMPELSPALGRGRPVVRWTFHRAEGRLGPKNGRLVKRPSPARETLRQALARKDWQGARQVLSAHPSQLSLASQVIGELLHSDDQALRWQVLALAAPARVRSYLLQRREPEVWSRGVALLARREADAVLRELYTELVPSRPGWGQAAEISPADMRLLDVLLPVLARRRIALPDAALERLARERTRPRLAVAAIELMRTRQALARSWAVWRHSDGAPALAIAARLCAEQCPRDAWRLLQAAVASGQPALLRTLARRPVPRLAADLARLFTAGKTPPIKRLAVKAYAAAGGSYRPLLRLLRSSDPALQRAAIEAVASCSDAPKLSVGYRLVEVAYKSRGELAAVALTGVLRLGHPRFYKDSLYLLARVDDAHRAQVLAELWRIGPMGIGQLKKALASKDPATRRSARASLARIDDPRAKAALEAAVAPAPTSQGEGGGLGIAPAPELQQLLQTASAMLQGKSS